MTTVIILIILACALPETSASIVSASRPCPLAVTVTQVLRRDVMVLMVMMVMMVLMVMVVMGLMMLMVVILAVTVTQVLRRDVMHMVATTVIGIISRKLIAVLYQ